MFLKVCGLTSVEDALMCVEAGVSSIGVNFVKVSPRNVSRAVARDIVAAVSGRVIVVGVVANCSIAELSELVSETKVDAIQLHGDETPEELTALQKSQTPTDHPLGGAYKAVRIGSKSDVERTSQFGGPVILVDAKVDGVLGGSGETFEWSLVRDLARARPILLAGGLTPENVGSAIRQIDPWGVDTASGVEETPGRKDRARVYAFVSAAKEAALSSRR